MTQSAARRRTQPGKEVVEDRHCYLLANTLCARIPCVEKVGRLRRLDGRLAALIADIEGARAQTEPL